MLNTPCSFCQKTISEERLAAIQSLNLKMTCLECAKNENPIRGLYDHENGNMRFIKAISLDSGIYRDELENRQEIIENIEEINGEYKFSFNENKE